MPEPHASVNADSSREADPRARILAATLALIGEVGWGQVTTRKVAARAGVNNALIHYYFGSKQRLLVEAATAAMLQEFGEPLALLADPSVTTVDAIRASVDWLGRTDLDDASLRVLSEIAVNGLREPELAAMSRSMLAEARAGLAVRLEHEGLDPTRAAGTATIVLALLDGLMLHRIIDPDLDFNAVDVALAPLFRKEPA